MRFFKHHTYQLGDNHSEPSIVEWIVDRRARNTSTDKSFLVLCFGWVFTEM